MICMYGYIRIHTYGCVFSVLLYDTVLYSVLGRRISIFLVRRSFGQTRPYLLLTPI